MVLSHAGTSTSARHAPAHCQVIPTASAPGLPFLRPDAKFFIFIYVVYFFCSQSKHTRIAAHGCVVGGCINMPICSFQRKSYLIREYLMLFCRPYRSGVQPARPAVARFGYRRGSGVWGPGETRLCSCRLIGGCREVSRR